MDFFEGIAQSFVKTFINDDRWLQLLNGLGVTILITLVAAAIGVVLGFLIAMVRSTYDMQLQGKKCRKPNDYVLKVLNVICNFYITIIRGTPVVIQLMIMYFIVFASSRAGIVAAFLSFGMNSAAYVAEIVRSGIMSIDKGQFEASRVLVKETSVAGYVALQDLTYVGNLIRSRTYEAFFPLITVALIYLIIVLILSFLLKKLERRLRNSDH